MCPARVISGTVNFTVGVDKRVQDYREYDELPVLDRKELCLKPIIGTAEGFIRADGEELQTVKEGASAVVLSEGTRIEPFSLLHKEK